MESKFKGTGVALVTPFNDDYTIDYSGLERLLGHVTEGGIDYLVVCGTTGEPSTMSEKEKLEVLRFVKANNPKNLPIVFGIGGNNTLELLDKYKAFEEDVDAFLSTSPYYNKPSQDGIRKHYELIADTAARPIFLYNVPGRTGSNVEAETTLALAKHTNIIGLKEASGDLAQCMAIVKDKPADFLLISGDDVIAVPMISIGASGLVSVVANALPAETTAMVNKALEGNFEAAAAQAMQLIDPIDMSFKEGSPGGVKYILSQLGVCGAQVRLPLTQPTHDLKKAISAFVSGREVLKS